MLKKIFLCFSCLIVSFNLVFVQPAKAWFFIPALANPAAMAFIGNAVVGGAALAMGIANIDDTKEHLTNLYNESRPLVEALGAKAKFAFDQATDKYIPMYFENAKSEISNLYNSVRDTILNIYDSTIAKKNSDVAGTLTPNLTYDINQYPVQTIVAPDNFLFKIESKDYKGDFVLSKDLIIYRPTGSKLGYWFNSIYTKGISISDFNKSIRYTDLGIEYNDISILIKGATTFSKMVSLAKLIDDNFEISIVSSDYIDKYNQFVNSTVDLYFPSIDANAPFYLPIPRAKTIEKVNDIPAGTDLVFNPVSQAWETPQGKVWQGTDSQLDVAMPNLKVLTNADGTVITDANGLPKTVVTSDGATWIDTKTGETVKTHEGKDEGTIPGDLTIFEKILQAIKDILNWLDSFFATLEKLLISIITALFVPSESFVSDNVLRLRDNFTSKFPDLFLIPSFFDSLNFNDSSCNLDFKGKVFGKQYSFIDSHFVLLYAPWWKAIMSAVMWFFVFAYGYRRISSIIAGRHGAK
jgi:hypothetical protein